MILNQLIINKYQFLFEKGAHPLDDTKLKISTVYQENWHIFNTNLKFTLTSLLENFSIVSALPRKKANT